MIQICKGNYTLWGYNLETQVMTNGKEIFLMISIFETGSSDHLMGMATACLNDLLGDDLYPDKHKWIQAFLFEPDLISTVHVVFKQFVSHHNLDIADEYLDAYEGDKMTTTDMYMEACYE